MTTLKVMLTRTVSGLTHLLPVKLNPSTQSKQVVGLSMQVEQGDTQGKQVTAWLLTLALELVDMKLVE